MDLEIFSNNIALWQGKIIPCRTAINGFTPAAEKQEGDGRTPLGRHPLRRVLYRADRVETPAPCALPIDAIVKGQYWSEQPGENYNTLCDGPPPPGCGIWREDSVFDLIIVIGYNDDPAIPGKGSGIFVHLHHTPPKPTQGCVAFEKDDLYHIITTLTPETHIVFHQEAYERG